MMKASRLGRVGRLAVVAALCALALCAMAALVGCSNSEERAREALTQGIEDDMARLTSLSSDAAAELFDTEFTADLQAAGVDPAEVYGPLFELLAYSIDTVAVDGDEATVTLTVSNRDLDAALELYTQDLTDELATQASRDELAALDEAELTRHMAELLVASVRDASVGTVSSTVELDYVKQGSTWELQNADELTVALMGGLDAGAGQASA